MKVLFMGTPEFAAVSLRRLAKEKDLRISVVTQPDRPQGRHMILTPSAVKKEALAHGFPVFQPESLKDGAFMETLAAVNPDLIAVVAYGKLLPEYILDYPRLGCINLHGSLLPAYRGAAPIQRMVMDGVKIYGVTTMYMGKGLDTGDMLEKWSARLQDDDDFGTVSDRLSKEGAELLLSTVRKAEEGTLHPIPQKEEEATYAPKIGKADCFLNFEGSAREAHNRIRGLFPVPLAYTVLAGKTLKILKSEIDCEKGNGEEPGRVLHCDERGILVACGEGRLRLLTVRPEGKGTMSAADFIKGRGILQGQKLGH